MGLLLETEKEVFIGVARMLLNGICASLFVVVIDTTVEAETPVVAYEKERRPPPMISQGRKASSGEIVISNNNINTANNNILVSRSAPSVRGDRVRGGAAKRVQSDKVR